MSGTPAVMPTEQAAVSGRVPARRKWGDVSPQACALALILVAYTVLALRFNAATPVGEAVDEFTHLHYVVHLHETRRLPVLSPLPDVGVHQAGHPPLYYVTAALVTAGMDVRRPELVSNPHFSFNWERPEPPPPNVFVHVQDPPFPYHGAPGVLAARVMRLVSTASHLAAIVGTYALAAAVFPGSGTVAAVTAGVVAFLPTFAFLGGAVNNDTMANGFAALALALIVRVAQGHARSRHLFAVGTLLGLGMMSKMTVAALLPVAALAVVVHGWRASAWRVVPRAAAWVGLPLVALTGWWVVRNAMLYGIRDPLGWHIWTQRTPDILRRMPVSDELGAYFQFQLLSTLGAFGWANIRFADPVYGVFKVLLATAAVGLIAFVTLRWRSMPADTRWGLVLVAAAAASGYALAFRLLFTFNLSVSQGRYLFGVLPAFALLAVTGLTGLLPRPARAAAGAALVAVLLALSSYAAFALVPAAYAPPAPLSRAEVAAIPHALQLDITDRARLVGYDVQPERPRAGAPVTVTLYWTAQESNWQPFPRTLDNLVVLAHMVDADGEVVARVDTEPFRGRHPVLAWRPGDVLRQTHHLTVAAHAEPGVGALLVGMYVHGDPDRRLPVFHDGALVGDVARIQPLVIRPAEQLVAAPSAATPRADMFGAPADALLSAASVSGDPARPGDSVTVTLYWTCEAVIADDLTVFVHLTADDGAPLATGDAPPRSGRYPTSLWEAGETVEDAHHVRLPPDMAPGRYRLLVGLYDPVTGARRPALDASGTRWPDDAVSLGHLTVIP